MNDIQDELKKRGVQATVEIEDGVCMVTVDHGDRGRIISFEVDAVKDHDDLVGEIYRRIRA